MNPLLQVMLVVGNNVQFQKLNPYILAKQDTVFIGEIIFQGKFRFRIRQTSQ